MIRLNVNTGQLGHRVNNYKVLNMKQFKECPRCHSSVEAHVTVCGNCKAVEHVGWTDKEFGLYRNKVWGGIVLLSILGMFFVPSYLNRKFDLDIGSLYSIGPIGVLVLGVVAFAIAHMAAKSKEAKNNNLVRWFWND